MNFTLGHIDHNFIHTQLYMDEMESIIVRYRPLLITYGKTEPNMIVS